MELSVLYLVIPLVVLATALVTVCLTLITVARRKPERSEGLDLSYASDTIIEASASGMCIVDADENIVFANPAFAEIIGRASREHRDGK